MTDFGRRPGLGDMLKSVYDVNEDDVIDAVIAHKASHENGGSDEIDCTGLDGAGGAGILGDGTSGRVLRFLFVVIEEGTAANSLKVRTGTLWNGHVISQQDDIVKNATTGYFTLSLDGSQLAIEVAGLGVNVLATMGYIKVNPTNISIRGPTRVSASRIRMDFTGIHSGAAQDMTAIWGAGELVLDVLYITDA